MRKSIAFINNVAIAASGLLFVACSSDSTHNYGYYGSGSAMQDETQWDTTPSNPPVQPSPDEVNRPIPPNYGPRSPQVVNLGPTIDPAGSYSKPMYLTDVRNQMGLLFREMVRIVAEARVKDAAAVTAVTPPAIEFARAQDQVEASLAMAQNARGEKWELWREPIDEGLLAAVHAVLDAQVALSRAPLLPLSTP